MMRRLRNALAGVVSLMGLAGADLPAPPAIAPGGVLAGQFRGYSVERLMRFLVALGHDVEIVVKPRKRGAAELRVA
jgi:hypothetical protein